MYYWRQRHFTYLQLLPDIKIFTGFQKSTPCNKIIRAIFFVTFDTIKILSLGIFAFVFDTAGGVLFAKAMNLFLKDEKKINPMVGACGISAFPMSARVIHGMGLKEDPHNYLLMPAISANVGGQIGSVIVGGLILMLVPLFA